MSVPMGVFIPYLGKQLQDTNRLDLVWDRYSGDSWKCLPEKREVLVSVRKSLVSLSYQIIGWIFFVTKWIRNSCLPLLYPRLKDSTGHMKKMFTSHLMKMSHVPAGVSPWKSEITRRRIHGLLCLSTTYFVMEQKMPWYEQWAPVLWWLSSANSSSTIYWIHNHCLTPGLHLEWVGNRYYGINALCQSLGASKWEALYVFHSYSGGDIICIPWQGQEVSLASLAGLWWSRRNIHSSGQASLPKTWCCFWAIQSPWKIACHRDKTKPILPRQSNNGEPATDTGCTPAACTKGSVSCGNLDAKLPVSATYFISTGLCLDQGIRILGASVDDNSRGLQSMSTADQMFLHTKLFYL